MLIFMALQFLSFIVKLLYLQYKRMMLKIVSTVFLSIHHSITANKIILSVFV